MPSTPKSDTRRLKSLIPRLRGKRIAVLGDLMLDRYLWGTASRLSPEAAVPVVDFVEQSEGLGGAGNVAANLAALGARVECFAQLAMTKQARRYAIACALKNYRKRRAFRPKPHDRSENAPSSRAISKLCAWTASAASLCGPKPKSASCAACSAH